MFLFRLTARRCLAETKPSVLLLLLVYVMNVVSGGGWERFAICESRFIGAQQCLMLPVFAFCLSLQHAPLPLILSSPDCPGVDSCLTSDYFALWLITTFYRVDSRSHCFILMSTLYTVFFLWDNLVIVLENRLCSSCSRTLHNEMKIILPFILKLVSIISALDFFLHPLFRSPGS